MSSQDLIRGALSAQNDGRLEEAVTLYRQILESWGQDGESPPSVVGILNNLGGLLGQLGRPSEAIPCYQKAVTLAPAQPIPQFNLGEALRNVGKAEEAIPYLRVAATLDPNLQEAWAMLGATLLDLSQAEAALGALRRAVELCATDDGSWRLLGDAFQTLRRFDEAISSYETALRHNSGNGEAWYGSGRAALETGHPAEAVLAFQKCLELHPDDVAAKHDLGKALYKLGCIEKAMPLFRQASHAEAIRDRALENLAILVPGSPEDDNRSILQTRRAWTRQLASAQTGKLGRDGKKAPLKIGYLSSFFHKPNWMKPVWGLVNHHDRRRVQIHLLSDGPAEQASAGGYRPHPMDCFHDVRNLPNDALARAIAELDIELLIDLNGYSAPRRMAVLALRPAPIQVGWFNFYATSGLDCMDYLIGDEHVVPPEEEPYYTEKVLRVPGSYLTFEVDHPVPAVATVPMSRHGRLTIGCLASQYKITDQVIRAWAEILRRCPEPALLIRNTALASAATREHLLQRFADQGIGRERVRLEGPAEHLEYLRTYDRIDFALDTFPYSGGTTTMEALWQGVPVVTFDGDRWASRTTVSLLRAAGLGEYVGRDRAEYIEICVGLIQSPGTAEKLRRFRAGVRDQLRRSPVCDCASFARSMEDLYLRM